MYHTTKVVVFDFCQNEIKYGRVSSSIDLKWQSGPRLDHVSMWLLQLTRSFLCQRSGCTDGKEPGRGQTDLLFWRRSLRCLPPFYSLIMSSTTTQVRPFRDSDIRVKRDTISIGVIQIREGLQKYFPIYYQIRNTRYFWQRWRDGNITLSSMTFMYFLTHTDTRLFWIKSFCPP